MLINTPGYVLYNALFRVHELKMSEQFYRGTKVAMK